MLACALAMAASAAVWAQMTNDFPKREDPLNVRADMFARLVRSNHWNEGIILPTVVLPPAGHTLPTVGQHQEAAFQTGLYLATVSRQYAVTKAPETRAIADELMDGILKLEKVTGETGCLARSLYRAEGPNWHEQAFFLPIAWHDSAAMPNYRWMGMLGADQFTAIITGVETYWEFCADDPHRKIAADFVDRVMGRCIENNFRIIDANGKTGVWGSLCPDLPHEPLKALMALADLRAAIKLTQKIVYQTAYNRLLVRYHFDEEAIMARDLAAGNSRGDLVAALALDSLIRDEDNPLILQRCRMSLNRYWHAWKPENDPLWAMIYQKLSGETVVDDTVVNAIKSLWGADRQHGSWNIITADGAKTMEADYEESPVRFLFAYWFGRQAGLIPAEW